LPDHDVGALAALIIERNWPNADHQLHNVKAWVLQDGLAFADILIYMEEHPGRYVLLRRLKALKIKMYKEDGHQRPHVHIDYGKQPSVASYALDTGERLVGDLDRRYDKTISAWITRSQPELLKIWYVPQSGGDPENLIAELKADDW
jgi:hypothetical protein